MNHPTSGEETSNAVRAFSSRIVSPCSSAVILLGSLLAAHAHPGHALEDHGVAHVVTSPYHLGVLALAGSGLWFAGWCVQRRLPRRLLHCAGVAALAGAAILWGLHL